MKPPDLIEYMGDIAWYLDGVLDRRPGGTEIVAVCTEPNRTTGSFFAGTSLPQTSTMPCSRTPLRSRSVGRKTG